MQIKGTITLLYYDIAVITDQTIQDKALDTLVHKQKQPDWHGIPLNCNGQLRARATKINNNV